MVLVEVLLEVLVEVDVEVLVEVDVEVLVEVLVTVLVEVLVGVDVEVIVEVDVVCSVPVSSEGIKCAHITCAGKHTYVNECMSHVKMIYTHTCIHTSKRPHV